MDRRCTCHEQITLLDFLSSRFSYWTREKWEARITLQIRELALPELRYRSSEVPIPNIPYSIMPVGSDSTSDGRQPIFICVNGSPVNESPSTFELRPGDIIQIRSDATAEPKVDINFQVLHQDADVIVVLKPPNLPVDESGRYYHNTLCGVLHTTGMTPRRPFVVHRLDKETSGILVLALNAESARSLSKQINHMQKEYQAVLVGLPPSDTLSSECKCVQADAFRLSDESKCPSYRISHGIAKACEVLGKDYMSHLPALRKIRMVCCSTEFCAAHKYMHSKANGRIYPHNAKAKESHTSIQIIRTDTMQKLSLVRISTQTGRTHQIRVHMEALGLPILGDKLYGQSEETFWQFARGEEPPIFYSSHSNERNTGGSPRPLCYGEIPHQLLHASKLSFLHPKTLQRMCFEVPCESYWKLQNPCLKFISTG